MPGFGRAQSVARRGWLRHVRWALAACLIVPLTGWTHAFWLVPFGPAVESGTRVALDLRIGPRWPGESTPRLPGLVRSFRVVDSRGSRDVAGRSGGTPIGHFDARVPGAALVSMETNPSTIALAAPAFQAYLQEEQLPEALKFRAELGLDDSAVREDFSRAAKTLVVVGGDSRGFDRVLGHSLELVPLTDPLAYRPGQPFGVRLLLAGRPAARVRIAALPQFNPERIVEARTGDDGSAYLALPHAGQWTLYAVHIEPAPRPPADWHSTWASLTFAIREAAK